MWESSRTIGLSVTIGPTLTLMAPRKPPPVMATSIPPLSGPAAGEMALICGGGDVAVENANCVAMLLADMPLAVVTLTLTTPLPAGLSAVICVSLSILAVTAGV